MRRRSRQKSSAAIGLSVRTGKATVVILHGTRRAPEIAVRFEMQLADRWVPESLHPYHQELGDDGDEARRARQLGCKAARASTMRSIRALTCEMKARGLEPWRAAIVVATMADPARVRGAHPRAHAEEGKLYREAVEAGLRSCKVRFERLLEKGLLAEAEKRLGRNAKELDANLKAFSHVVGTPWSAPEKQATLAAWLALPA